MQPHLGAGASVGLEDAYCVAELLGNPQTTVENAGVSSGNLLRSQRILIFTLFLPIGGSASLLGCPSTTC